ncbi:hypothetical protein H2200_004935 [Cladophialophora chaetospira]|uniref:DUF7514 domain-containing protein n=1 Tax=Cladophialophora chaetospira TaxID=386627 RepID=A0AA38XE09_9EURO|nr:hypothetical protein H2200_004935 [Cladophialophora chaetospira]
MDPKQPAPGYWRYLINPDKSATSQFEQLCKGIAKVIATLEPGPNDELTPSRLARFYRAVGGNYDSLFLKSSDTALSFMYQTLGCFHSLQPTISPFETPRIPCLNPTGFARWQTIQLLLCPEENVGFIQKAVQLWNVPAPNGGIYPKYIPQDVFPSRPDEAMEKWHKMVTGKLNQQNYNMRRIQNSPYHSPHLEPHDRRDGYFPGGQVGRPARPSRSSSRDEDQLAAMYRRRSSVPDFPSPAGERGSHWDPSNQHEARKARSHSAQRSSPKPSSRQRSRTTTEPASHQKSSKTSPSSHRHGAVQTDPNGRRSSGGYNMAYRSPARTPSTVKEDSGSEGSSEASQNGRRHRKSDEERKSRRSSLWPPFLRPSHKRRHSSDAGYHAPDPRAQPSQPSRPEYHPPRAIKPAPQPQAQPYRGTGAPPQWRDPAWDNNTPLSTPVTPTQAQMDPRGPAIRFPDQQFEPLTRESSSGSDNRPHSHRQQVPPGARIATVTGVSGRKYPTSDPMSPIERQRTHPPRGHVPTMV